MPGGSLVWRCDPIFQVHANRIGSENPRFGKAIGTIPWDEENRPARRHGMFEAHHPPREDLWLRRMAVFVTRSCALSTKCKGG